MWSELFDIDSPARPGFDGQERRSWSWHRCPLGPSEAVFRGLAAVCGQRSGLERAVSLPSDEAKAAFLHQHMSLRFRYRLRWTAWRYGAVYDGLEPTFLVEVLTRTFLKSFVCSLDPKQLAYNVRKWRNLVLEELDEVYPDSPYNLLLVGSLGRRSRPEIQSCSSGSIIRRSRIVSTQSARL